MRKFWRRTPYFYQALSFINRHINPGANKADVLIKPEVVVLPMRMYPGEMVSSGGY